MTEATRITDAVIVATGRLDGIEVVVAAMEYAFIGGSMGIVEGEKITRAVEMALERRQPLIIVSCSGGARMMEGVLSLMQMAKISAALARLDRAGVPFVSVLTDPTTGGVTASFAMLGDLNIAEPKALIGFAGPRVIEQTIRQKLPEGFQRSEFLLEHGMLDIVVDRREMKALLGARAALHGCRLRRRSSRQRQQSTARRSTPNSAEVLDRLFALETFGIKLGLENISRLCEALGHPERSFTALHIAGTNGKGSVTAMVHAALVAAGIRAARYVSPHLVDLRRTVRHRHRTRRCRQRSRKRRRRRARLRRAASRGGRVGRASHVLRSHDRHRVRAVPSAPVSTVAVIEVGLGGRFDSTNVVPASAGAITSIGLRSPGPARRYARGNRVREGRHHQGRHAGGHRSPARSGAQVVAAVADDRRAHLIDAVGEHAVDADATMDAPRVDRNTGRHATGR